MLTYSTFLAKINNPNEDLNLNNVRNYIPTSFNLIKNLVKFIDLLNEDKYKSIKWAIENILSIVNNVDIYSVVEELHFKYNTGEKDPYIYFYENFLNEYDKEQKNQEVFFILHCL